MQKRKERGKEEQKKNHKEKREVRYELSQIK
jgi:hypothetical protein